MKKHIRKEGVQKTPNDKWLLSHHMLFLLEKNRAQAVCAMKLKFCLFLAFLW